MTQERAALCTQEEDTTYSCSTGRRTHLSSISCVRLVTAGSSIDTPVSFSTWTNNSSNAQAETNSHQQALRVMALLRVSATFECTCCTMKICQALLQGLSTLLWGCLNDDDDDEAARVARQETRFDPGSMEPTTVLQSYGCRIRLAQHLTTLPCL